VATKKQKQADAETKAPAFSIDQLVESQEFSNLEKDFLKAFAGERKYSIAEAKTLLDKKLKGEVK